MTPIKLKGIPIRKLVVTAIMSAIAFVLMMLDFSIPIVPVFLKMDFSDFPALLTSFALGPVYGMIVCLIKNLFHLFLSNSVGVGELSNLLLGICFVVPAGLIYKHHRTFKGAITGAAVGNVAMALICWPINMFLIYPMYERFMGYPIPAILEAYQKILPGINSISAAIAVFNIPFTFVKGLASVIVTFLIYKRIAPLLRGRK